MNNAPLLAKIGDGQTILDEENLCVTRNGDEVGLRTQSVRLFALLLRRKNVLVSMEEIRNYMSNWGYEMSGTTNVSKVISHIRVRAAKDAGCDIVNVPGQGYRFKGAVVILDRSSQSASDTIFHPPTPSSPFVVGTIPNPRQFVGREKELKKIRRRLSAHPLQHVAIVGDKRIGKSSLLRQISNDVNKYLENAAEYTWVEIDFHNEHLRQKDGFYNHVLSTINSNRQLRQNEAATNFALEVEQLNERPIVFLLDHFDRALAEDGDLDDGFWDTLRSCSKHGHVAFLVFARELPANLKQRYGCASEFFNIFGTTVPLGVFNESELDSLMDIKGEIFQQTDRSWIHENSKGFPELAQRLCYARWEAFENGDFGSNWQDEALTQLKNNVGCTRS